MTPITDEQAMRAALADLTNDQPPMAPGRFQAVRRRVIRHRKRQLAGAVVAVLAVAGIAVGAARIPGMLQPTPQARQVPGWALPWPDYRNGSVPQSVLNKAVLAWHQEAVGQTAPALLTPKQIARRVVRQIASYHVIWYVGQTVARGQAVAVMFEATSPDTGPVLVVGWADASQVMGGQAAWSTGSSPWVLTTKAAPRNPGYFRPDISEYVPVGHGADTWIVVLPAPGALMGTWTSTTGAGGVAVTGARSSRVFVAEAGKLTTDALLWVGAARTKVVPVGIGGVAAVPPLEPPAALTPPGSFSEVSGATGQGNELNKDSGISGSGGRYAVLGRCYSTALDQGGTAQPTPNGQPVAIAINGHSIGTISCDFQQHQLKVPRFLLRPHRVFIGIGSSDLTSWRVAVGRVH